MSWFLLTKEGERPKAARPAPPRMLPPTEPGVDPEPDPRPDSERVLDGYEGWTVAHALDRPPDDFETIDTETGAILLDVAAIDAHLHSRIDREAGEFRCRFITDIAGQEMTYLRKEEEARSFAAGGSGPFPMLTAEASAREMAIADLASEVISQADSWVALAALIEAARLGAKKAVTEAVDRETKALAAVVDWEALLAPPQGE